MENDSIVALYIRVASLETEIHLLRNQIEKSVAGGAYLIDLIGAQRIENTPSPQQAAIEASKEQLQQRVNELVEENQALKGQLEANLKEENASLHAKLDAALKSNNALQRQLEPFQNAAKFGRQQELNEQIESSREFGSWAGGDAFDRGDRGHDVQHAVPESVERWVKTCAWPSSVEDCKRGPAVEIIAPKAEQASGSKDAAASASEVGSCLSMDAGCSVSSAVEEKSENSSKQAASQERETVSKLIDEAILRIEATNGECFYVHPPPSLTSTEDANKHPLRRETRSLKPRVQYHEHNRLAGAATFIESYDEVEYAEHWIVYAREHRDHSARQWREYYEAEIRPAYLKKVAESKHSAEKNGSTSGGERKESKPEGGKGASKSGGERKDSLFAQANGAEVRSPIEGEKNRASSSTATEPFPLIDMEAIAEEEPVVAASSKTTKQPETAVKPPFVRYNTQQLRDCRPFARSVVKDDKRIAPDDPDFSTVYEMNNLREMPIRAVTKGDVKEVEIKSSSASGTETKKA